MSGIIVTVFIILHLVNHTASIFGPGVHISIMTCLRQFYRNPFAETILLTAVSIQIISGLRLFMTNREGVKTNFDRLQRGSGLYLAIFLVIHISAVSVGRILLHLDTNFYFGVAGLNSFPINLFFIPYYGLAVLSFFAHIASIHARKMKVNILGIHPLTQAKVIFVFGFLLVVIILYGLTNQFKGVSVPVEYNVLTGK